MKDLPAGRRCYEAALAPLGYRTVAEYPGLIGLGLTPDRPPVWIGSGEAGMPGHPPLPLTTGVQIAFTGPDRKAVSSFHAAALAAGGRDNGAPGLRPHYHAIYFGALVRDPDGNNIEAVCHSPEQGVSRRQAAIAFPRWRRILAELDASRNRPCRGGRLT